jgi:t-SNARE complex subunit (syntaxin)
MKKLAQEFGTESDTQELRDRMHEGRTKTAALGKETANLLKAQAADKARQDKLKRQLQSQLAEFEKMSQDHRRQEREILVQMEEQYSSTYNRAPDLGGSYQEEEETVGRGRTRTKLALELADGMEDADAKIIQERNREVQMLDNELGEVVDLFNEVNGMVEEQGTKLDEADTRLEMSEVRQSARCLFSSQFFFSKL